MDNSKSKLVNFCQINNIKMPEYKHQSIMSSVSPIWLASVSIIYRGEKISAMCETYEKSKVEAEKKAADLLLQKIEKINDTYDAYDIQNHIKIIDDNTDIKIKSQILSTKSRLLYKKIYMIDLENKPQFNLNIDENVLYIGFICTTHHAVPKYNTWHICNSENIMKELFISNNPKLLFTISSGVTDAVDHLMTVLIIPIINFIREINVDEETTVIIISCDKAGYCTKDCMDQVLKWNNITNIKVERDILIK
jgi:hypothetical protein